VASENVVKIINDNGEEEVLYEPQDDPRCNQAAFHLSNTPNLLALGTRNTGKSWTLRWDAIIRCLMFPGFKALLLRRTVPDLRKSHLQFIPMEMARLGGVYLSTTMEARFPNGSLIQFSHCEKMTDVVNYLGSQWGWIGFDELSTFSLEMFLMICAASRVPPTMPYRAVVRAGSNTLGIGSAWMKQWFIDREVNYADFPDYQPDDFEVQYSWLDANKFADVADYTRRLKVLPEHVRRSWLNMEFVVEGAYFSEFHKRNVDDDGNATPWHCIQTMPTWVHNGVRQHIRDIPWIKVYRSIDWGYHPDPAVCHWHLVMPNGRKITFMEKTWKRTLAKDVALEIKRASSDMHIVETSCDPTMFVKDGSAPFSIADIFEQNGVPLTPAQNDRELYGYSVHEMLATEIEENGRTYPSWQIMEHACPELVRTLPILQMDATNPKKIADGPDHWVISCAYFGMSLAAPSKDPVVSVIPRWMQKWRR
jgi:hypothetical protein